MRVYLEVLGCKLNQSETEDWARRLVAAGCDIVEDPTQAELCIINTCTVTHVAARKSRNLARRCARANPRARVMLTGCYAEINPAEAAGLPGVSWVLGTAEKEHLVERVKAEFGLALAEPSSNRPSGSTLRTRAVVKIQDGCDNACAYCIVRVARGRQRSRPLADVLDEVLTRQAEGYQEVVLTGVHIGAYGRERRQTLTELVRVILAQTEFPRLRLSSIEPWDLAPDLLKLWEERRLCRHVHLPLQSGCDATLRRMNRRYTSSHFRHLLATMRAAIPDLAVTTDVIVGFPGEDAQEFESSAAFVDEMHLARVHVFPFSARTGTPAASMPGQVPPQVKDERSQRMRAIGHAGASAFQCQFLGREMDVLWETREGAQWRGLTDNYIHVEVTSTQDLRNLVLPARLLELQGDGVRAELTAARAG